MDRISIKQLLILRPNFQFDSMLSTKDPPAAVRGNAFPYDTLQSLPPILSGMSFRMLDHVRFSIPFTLELTPNKLTIYQEINSSHFERY